MKKKNFATALAASIISAAGFATAQNLVDPVTNDTDLSGYSHHMSREVAEGLYGTHLVRTLVNREPVLTTTSPGYQSQCGMKSLNTRQLDCQHRRSGPRLAQGLPQPEPTPPPQPKPMPPVLASGEILGLELVPSGLPAGSVEVVGPALAKFRVNPGIRLYRAPSGKYYYIKDPAAPGSKGSKLTFGEVPEGSKVVHPASVGVTSVPEGFVVVRGPDKKLSLAPASRFGL
ncbi:MAG: hypothetical protein CME02_01225 [Geminicoccus sp.]|nr:hypothetical protein [Geminicoccus sp.]